MITKFPHYMVHVYPVFFIFSYPSILIQPVSTFREFYTNVGHLQYILMFGVFLNYHWMLTAVSLTVVYCATYTNLLDFILAEI